MILLYGFLLSCSAYQAPQQIIQESANFHGLPNFINSEISFHFRGADYSQKSIDGRFVFTKHFIQNDSTFVDSLKNTGFSRYINGEAVALSTEYADKRAAALNSVIYFASLPFRFLDNAVLAENLGVEKIQGEELFKIRITFKEENGGEDFDDVFIVWISKENYRLVYVAYEYHVNGGGMRFRKAKTYHRVNGITLISYENYKPKAKISLTDIGMAFGHGELEFVSDILLENIQVKLL